MLAAGHVAGALHADAKRDRDPVAPALEVAAVASAASSSACAIATSAAMIVITQRLMRGGSCMARATCGIGHLRRDWPRRRGLPWLIIKGGPTKGGPTRSGRAFHTT